MGRKSRYSGYVQGMNKKVGTKNATRTNNKSIKNRLQELKEQSRKGVK